jgi:Domain of unknown function (DUF4288)
MARYAANLLFEYGVEEAPSRRPLCERRIVVFEARGAKDAVRRAKQRGKRAEQKYRNADGQTFRVTFVGLIDVIELSESDPDEVYYSMRRTSSPTRHVRADDRLAVMASKTKTLRSSWWAVPEWLARPKRQRSTGAVPNYVKYQKDRQ